MKKINVVCFLALLLLLVGSGLKAQSNIPLRKEYALKFIVFHSSRVSMDSAKLRSLDSIISNDKSISIRELKKQGFDDFNFYEISQKIDQKLSLNYVVAENTNTGRLYRIKGFLNNDFYYLLKLQLRIQEDIPVNFLNKRSLKKFLEGNKIESIDLDCLVKNYNKKENWKIPCLDPSNQIIIDDFGEEYY